MAHQLTPRPTNSASPGMPERLASTPGARMTAVALMRSWSVTMPQVPSGSGSMAATVVISRSSAPNSAAWRFILSARSKPEMPSGKPG